MSVRIRVCVAIDAPVARVWETVEQIEHHTEWMTDARRITFRSSHTRGVGTEFDCLTRVGIFRLTDRMTVTEWEPRAALGIEHHGVVSGRGRFTLRKRRNDRTRFCWSERLRFPWWMGGFIGELAAWPVLRRIWKRNLTQLRAVVEARS